MARLFLDRVAKRFGDAVALHELTLEELILGYLGEAEGATNHAEWGVPA